MTLSYIASNPLRWLGGKIDIRVEVEVLAEGGGVWDVGEWDTAHWATFDWYDITKYVESIHISRGQPKWESRYAAGSCKLTLDNTSGLFNPEVEPHLDAVPWRPGRRLRVLAFPDPSDPSTFYPLFTGRIDDSGDSFDFGTRDIVNTTRALDALAELHAFNPLALETATGVQSTDARVHAALDRLDWPEEDRDIQEGLHTMQTSYLAQTALEECQRAAEAEGGALFADTENKVVFKARDWLTTDPRSTEIQGYLGYPKPDPIGPYLIGDHSGTVTVPDDDSLDITDAITIIAVARLNDDADISQYNRFCQKGGGFADWIGFRGSDGFALWYIGALANWQIGWVPEMRAPSTGGDGEFHHLAYTYDKDAGTNNRRFYVDGGLRASRTDTDPLPTSSNPFAMITSSFGGDLAYVAIYDRQLSDQEIADLHAGAVITDGLVSEWKLNEGSGTTVHDSVGGNDGTISGLVWFDPGGPPEGANTAPISAIRPSWDIYRIVNHATFARTGGSAYVAEDTDSKAVYGVRTYQRLDYQNNTDSEVEFLADRYIEARSGLPPRIRVDEVTIGANPDPDNKDLNRLFYDTQFGDLLAVKVDSEWGWSFECLGHVIGIEHNITPEDWEVTFTLDDALIPEEDES